MEAASAQRNFWWEYWLPRDDIFLCLFFSLFPLTPLNQTTQEPWPVIQKQKKKKPKQNVTVKDILSVRIKIRLLKRLKIFAYYLFFLHKVNTNSNDQWLNILLGTSTYISTLGSIV